MRNPYTQIIKIVMLMVCIALAGCSVHKSLYDRHPAKTPDTFSSNESEPAAPVGKWWKQFGNSRLDSLMEDAFRQNLDIAQAHERLRQSQAIARRTGAVRGIRADIDASAGRSRQAALSGAITEDTYTLSAAAAYEIDLWNKLESSARAAGLDALASREELKTLFISISAELADLYYVAVEQRAQLELSDEIIASFTDTLRKVERRYREGLVPAVDVYQSRQNLASALAQRPVFRQNLETTLNALSVLTGKFPDQAAGGTEKDLKLPPALPTGLPAQLLSRRPDIKAALLRLRANDERVAAAVADRFPSFSLTGKYGGASKEIKQVLDSPNILWNILLQAALPVIDGGRRKAEVDRTASLFRESLAGYQSAVLNAFREVEDALAGKHASRERIHLLEEIVNASENSLRIATDRYLQGLTDYLPVLTEQLRYLNAKSDLLTARRRLISDHIQLARALGGSWADDAVTQYLTMEK